MSTSLITQTSAPAAASPVIIKSFMKPAMVERCFALAEEALKRGNIEKDQAAYIKKELQKDVKNLWNVVVGAHFGASVCHEQNEFLLFKIGRINFLIFQSFNDLDILQKADTKLNVLSVGEDIVKEES